MQSFRPGRDRGLFIAVIPALRKLGLEFKAWLHETKSQNSNTRAFKYELKETVPMWQNCSKNMAVEIDREITNVCRSHDWLTKGVPLPCIN